MTTSVRGFVIYGREKTGLQRWSRFGAETYPSRSDAEYAMKELESKPKFSHLQFEVRPARKTAEGFIKGSSRRGPTFKNPFR